MIEIENITVRRGGKSLLRGVSLAVRPGEFLAVLGPNGAGKSTLLRIAAGEFTPDAGTVHIDGRDLNRIKQLELARHRAVLPQSSAVSFPATAEEIVALGRSPHHGLCTQIDHRRAIERAMAQADMLPLSQRSYVTLSGGEQQRVQLARVLAQIDPDREEKEPRYLLLDEPTTSLDLAHQHAILRVARSLTRRQVGVLAVLHDLNLAATYADRMVVLKDGAILAEGGFDDVLRPDVVKSAFDVDIHVVQLPGGARFVASQPDRHHAA